jgi:hypothetical protein
MLSRDFKNGEIASVEVEHNTRSIRIFASDTEKDMMRKTQDLFKPVR